MTEDPLSGIHADGVVDQELAVSHDNDTVEVEDLTASPHGSIEIHTDVSESDRPPRQGPVAVVFRPTQKWPTSGS